MNQSQSQTHRFITISEAAELLQIPEKSLRNALTPGAKNPFMLNGKRIKPIRISSRVRLDREEIEKIINA